MTTRFTALLFGLGACFSPAPLTGTPCPDGSCPDGLACSAVTQTCELPGEVEHNGTCIGTDLELCPETVIGVLVFDQPTTIDTDGACLPSTDPDICLIAGRNVSVSSRLRAKGSRPLVVLALETLVVDVDGTIDVASHGVERGAGAQPAACSSSEAADMGDGGAGGSFAGRGGAGGICDGGSTCYTPTGTVDGPTAAAATTDTAFRGGCRGGDGTSGSGGDGGGAVYLVATSITIDGIVNASGASGTASRVHNKGGGGGGSGGTIVFDAPAIVMTGQVFANGGAGGAGNDTNQPAADSSTAMSPAVGGIDTGSDGNGGNGSVGSTFDGAIGGNGSDGGGGGGGGAGMIRVLANVVGNGVWSPAIR
jgi:hypothetical protein